MMQFVVSNFDFHYLCKHAKLYGGGMVERVTILMESAQNEIMNIENQANMNKRFMHKVPYECLFLYIFFVRSFVHYFSLLLFS